jgi:hypothetical protein
MSRKIRIKPEMEILMSAMVRELGYMPSAKDLSDILGGDPSGWGRILKRQCRPSGEYHAKLKRVRDVGLENTGFELNVAEISKKYRWKTRNGGLVPHTKFLVADMEIFYIDQKVREKINNMHFENDKARLDFHRNELRAMYEKGFQWPKDSSGEHTLRRDFIKSLP